MPVDRRAARRLLSVFLALTPLAACFGLLYFTLGVDPHFVAGFLLSFIPSNMMVRPPAEVSVSEWAGGLTTPTSIAFGPDGRLYVAQLFGDIVALSDADGDGRAESRAVYASGFTSPLGLAFRGGDLYVGRRGGVDLVRDTNGDGLADDTLTIVSGLPALRHQTNGLAFGDDGRLFIGTGSTSDRGETPILPLEASILAVEAACLEVPQNCNASLQVFASGLRNPYDLAIHPETGALFATDNGRDVPASGVPDELNAIVEGGRYGWPGCWGEGRGRDCEGTVPPVAFLPERASADGLAFYTGNMFPQWEGNLFVALYGAHSRDPAIGHVVLRIELSQDANGGWSGVVHDFAAGFDRPLDVAAGPDGALYVADFGRGAVYRLYAQ